MDLELDTSTLSGDLRTAIMDRIRAMDLTWGMMPQTHQRALGQEIDQLCRHLVRQAVELIAADGRPAIVAKCGEVKRHKAGHIEAKISIAGTDEQRHELFDSTGLPVLVIVADVERYIGEKEGVRTDRDQGDLYDAA